jgi:hypothetical protein
MALESEVDGTIGGKSFAGSSSLLDRNGVVAGNVFMGEFFAGDSELPAERSWSPTTDGGVCGGKDSFSCWPHKLELSAIPQVKQKQMAIRFNLKIGLILRIPAPRFKGNRMI